jgi:hypothetical protein
LTLRSGNLQAAKPEFTKVAQSCKSITLQALQLPAYAQSLCRGHKYIYVGDVPWIPWTYVGSLPSSPLDLLITVVIGSIFPTNVELTVPYL